MTSAENKKLPAQAMRECFSDLGLTYADVTESDAVELVALIGQQINAFKHRGVTDIDMSVSAKIKFRYDKQTHKMKSLFTFVDGEYFKKREMVSFNEDGYIGFAGWASSNNLAPILSGFHLWCLYLASKKHYGDTNPAFTKGLVLTNEYGGEDGYTYATCMECGSRFYLAESDYSGGHTVDPHEYKCCPICRSIFPKLHEEEAEHEA